MLRSSLLAAADPRRCQRHYRNGATTDSPADLEKVVSGTIINRVILIGVAIGLLSIACFPQQPVSDLNSLIGRKAIAQRMPFYVPGTFKAIPNTYAGQEVTIVAFKPTAMPKLPRSALQLTPEQKATIEDAERAGTLVVQFEDGTIADTGLVTPSLLTTYLELEKPSGPTPAAGSNRMTESPTTQPAGENTLPPATSRLPPSGGELSAEGANPAIAPPASPVKDPAVASASPQHSQPDAENIKAAPAREATLKASTVDDSGRVDQREGSSSTSWWRASSAAEKSATVSLSQDRIFFPLQPVGSASPPTLLAITNRTPGVLTLPSITVTGDSASDFVQSNRCPSTLSAGEKCIVSVSFRPMANGTRTAVLALAGMAETVRLEGIGK
jgi:hypothetical protein